MGLLTRYLETPQHRQLRELRASLATADWTAVDGSAYHDQAGLSITVDRDQAMAVPAVARARNVIVGTAGTLPLELVHNGTINPELGTPPAWVEQHDLTVPNVAHMAWTLDDLLFHGRAYWQVDTVYADTRRPRSFRRVRVNRVAPKLSTDGQRVTGWTVDGRAVPPQGPGSLVAINGHDDGVLHRGAITIRTALELERAAYRYAETPNPSQVLKNNGADLTTAKRDELLAGWQTQRRKYGTAYLGAAFELMDSDSWSAADLQLVEGRQHVAAEVARMMGVEPHQVGADQGAGSSMNYSNTQQERQKLVDQTLRPYLAAVEQRLSMPDVLARGLSVRFDLDDYLRADAQERAAYYAAMIGAGIMDPDEARAAEGLEDRAAAPARDQETV